MQDNDLGSVGSGLTPLVPSPSAAGLIAQPSEVVVSRDQLERALRAMFDWGVHCHKRRSFMVITDTGTEGTVDTLTRNALSVLGMKASQAPVASDGEGTLGEAKGPTEPKPSPPANHTEESKP